MWCSFFSLSIAAIKNPRIQAYTMHCPPSFWFWLYLVIYHTMYSICPSQPAQVIACHIQSLLTSISMWKCQKMWSEWYIICGSTHFHLEHLTNPPYVLGNIGNYHKERKKAPRKRSEWPPAAGSGNCLLWKVSDKRNVKENNCNYHNQRKKAPRLCPDAI